MVDMMWLFPAWVEATGSDDIMGDRETVSLSLPIFRTPVTHPGPECKPEYKVAGLAENAGGVYAMKGGVR